MISHLLATARHGRAIKTLWYGKNEFQTGSHAINFRSNSAQIKRLSGSLTPDITRATSQSSPQFIPWKKGMLESPTGATNG